MIKVGTLCIVRGLTLDLELNGRLVTVMASLVQVQSTRDLNWAWAYPCAVIGSVPRCFRPKNLIPLSDPDSVGDRGDVLISEEQWLETKRYVYLPMKRYAYVPRM